MNFYQHHLGDYAKDTAHLSILEDGCYRRMIDVYYAAEKPLPKNRVAIYRLVRAHSKLEREAVDIVLSEYFEESPEGWRQKRCDEELERWHSKSEKARTSAGKRWQSAGNANAMPTQCEGNAPINQYPIPNKEESTTTANAVVAADAAPDCPHDALIALYHELLPDCPRVLEWNDARRGYMRSRWREKAKPNGVTQGYRTTEAGLAWWRQFFEFVAQSKFLKGQSDGRDGRPPFVADLEWLVRPKNFPKVIEGRYHHA